MLAKRMTRHGFMLSGGTLAVLLSQNSASASMPVSLIASTTKAATVFAAGQAATGVVVSAKVAALTEGVLKAMLLTKLKFTTAMLVAVVALGAAGTGAIGQSRRAETSSPAKGVEEARPKAVEAQAQSETTRRVGPNPDEEMKKLEGTWAVTDATEGGQRVTPDMKAKGLGRVVIKGDKMTLSTMGDQQVTTFTFDVDPSHNPKIMGLILLNDKIEEDRHQPIRLGIYELKGDTLTICMGADRPDSFEVVPGSNRDLLVLKWARR